MIKKILLLILLVRTWITLQPTIIDGRLLQFQSLLRVSLIYSEFQIELLI